MLPPLADLSDLSARLGVTLDAESPAGQRGMAALQDASALIRSFAEQTWLDEDDSTLVADVPDVIVAICLAAALRAYRNPGGAVQASVGDVSVSYGTGALGAAIFLTKDEIRAIRREVGLAAAGSIPLSGDTFPAAAAEDDLPAPVAGGGDPIPLGPVPWE